jgi:hypothetical protein
MILTIGLVAEMATNYQLKSSATYKYRSHIECQSQEEEEEEEEENEINTFQTYGQ